MTTSHCDGSGGTELPASSSCSHSSFSALLPFSPAPSAAPAASSCARRRHCVELDDSAWFSIPLCVFIRVPHHLNHQNTKRSALHALLHRVTLAGESIGALVTCVRHIYRPTCGQESNGFAPAVRSPVYQNLTSAGVGVGAQVRGEVAERQETHAYLSLARTCLVAATATTSSGGRSGLYGTSAPLRAVSVMDSLSNLRPSSKEHLVG